MYVHVVVVVVVAGGMNGSIVYELERPENAGLKKSVKACSVSLFSQTPSCNTWMASLNLLI